MSALGYFDVQPVDAGTLANDLASLGYPGFVYLKSKRRKNPGEVLLSALSSNCLESRAAEALPWLVLNYPNLDWHTLINTAKAKLCRTSSALLPAWRARLQSGVGRWIPLTFFAARRGIWNVSA